MISSSEIEKVGKCIKTHGIKGEVSVFFDKDNFDEANLSYLIFNIDGIYVPFFIEDYRFKSDNSALYKFEGINSESEAKILSGLDIFIHLKFMLETETESSIHDFIGYTINDKYLGVIGEITDINDSTENILFVVKKKDDEFYIPVTNDFVLSINEDDKILNLDLPKGLINFEEAESE
jgi:16S rRNA processing protein RimM